MCVSTRSARPAWPPICLQRSSCARARNGQSLKGRVLRMEPKADAVTETLAKVVFDNAPTPLAADR